MAGSQTSTPVEVNGRVVWVQVDMSGDARRHAQVEAEQERIRGVLKRRSYFEGTQFDDENLKTKEGYCQGERRNERLPEHKRLHAYSTQIEDCLRFMANRISSGLQVEPDDATVAEVIDEMVKHSPQVWTYDEDGEQTLSLLEPLSEALVAGDIAVHVQWDDVDGALRLELWESEYVEVQQDTLDGIDKVILSQHEWRQTEMDTWTVELKTLTWEYATNEMGVRDVRLTVQWESDKDPEYRGFEGLGRIPWALLRGRTKGVRAVRGESMISSQAMETADRYNAVEQVGYLISRYNSHANVAVIGDAALMKVESEGKVNKDVADVLTFPGGTALQVLTLPTDPQMIDHQRNVLAEALYNQFGVTRLDAESLNGLGALSGYALEILNQKSQATFDGVTQQWRRDLIGLFDLALDVHAWRSESPLVAVKPDGAERSLDVPDEQDDDGISIIALDDDETVVRQFWLVDPAVVHPNRKIRVVMGNGYIVDDVKVRDDFKFGLISRREALRSRGYDDKAIDTIQDEIKAEAPPEVGPSFGEGTSTTARG